MMVPVGRMIVVRSVSKPDLVRALSFLAMPSLIGPMMGPPLGGFIVTYADWRWIFFVNIPIGILGIVLATLFIPDASTIRRRSTSRASSSRRWGSAALWRALPSAAAASRRRKWPSPSLHRRRRALRLYAPRFRVEKPLLDLRLLRFPTFEAGILGGTLFRLGVGATAFLLPLMLQLGFGLDAFSSGLITFAGAIGASP